MAHSAPNVTQYSGLRRVSVKIKLAVPLPKLLFLQQQNRTTKCKLQQDAVLSQGEPRDAF